MPRKSTAPRPTAVSRARAIFKRQGGLLRTGEALGAGIHRDTLETMLRQGAVERLSRGLYRLVESDPLSHPDLAIVATKVPKGVVCLISALAYHELTTQIPHEVYVAIERNSEPPRLDYPPVRSFRFASKAFTEGIETHRLDGVPVRIYSREKTLADCFKYRNKIGLDTTLEALRSYKEQGRVNVDKLLEYAAVCRVTRVMRPYLEAILVTRRQVKDVAASIRQRLQNVARQTGRPFQEVLEYFAMERFLYRLSQSPHADKFILKGALAFATWGSPQSRPTRDIDLLGRMDNSVEAVGQVIRDICTCEVEPDGIVFDVASLKCSVIKEDADYQGVRVTFRAYLQNARVAMQIDIGFGDVVTPAATIANYPTLLDLAAPRLSGYPRETVVAEKFEAMVKLGLLNSRIKDYFDIWLLSRQFDFDGPPLAEAMQATFANRGTEVASLPFALTAGFATDGAKQTQWRGFLKKSRIGNAPEELTEVVDAIAGFLLPVAAAVSRVEPFDQHWHAPGPWVALANRAGD